MLVISLNNIIFVFTLIELFIGVVFIIPLPKGWKPGLLRFVEESKVVKQLLQYHNFVIFAVALHWAYSIKIASEFQEMHDIEKQAHFNTISQRDYHILEQKFKAESDIYLNGSLLFTSIFINRLIALLQYYYQIKQLSELELKVDLSKDIKTIKEQLNKSPATTDSKVAAEQPKSKVEKKND